MGYTILKIIHLLSVVLFMGNIITGIFWMHYAVRSRNREIIFHTIRGIIKADRYFTIPAVSVLLLAGVGAALHNKLSIHGTGWIIWSFVMILVSGFAFSAKLAPLQKKMLRLAQEENNSNLIDQLHFKKLLRQWDTWGLVATLFPFLAFLMMVLKFPK